MPTVLADLVWPAMFLEQRLLSVLPISCGLLVEWLFLWRGGFNLSWKRAIVVDLAMNAVSTLIGIVLIPALGIVWEFFPGVLLYKLWDVGTFNPGTWIATFFLAVFATTSVEAGVVHWGFKISIDKRRYWVLWAANSASVAMAFASFLRHPPHT